MLWTINVSNATPCTYSLKILVTFQQILRMYTYVQNFWCLIFFIFFFFIIFYVINVVFISFNYSFCFFFVFFIFERGKEEIINAVQQEDTDT